LYKKAYHLLNYLTVHPESLSKDNTEEYEAIILL